MAEVFLERNKVEQGIVLLSQARTLARMGGRGEGLAQAFVRIRGGAGGGDGHKRETEKKHGKGAAGRLAATWAILEYPPSAHATSSPSS
jgi:hypothetical protein